MLLFNYTTLKENLPLSRVVYYRMSFINLSRFPHVNYYFTILPFLIRRVCHVSFITLYLLLIQLNL